MGLGIRIFQGLGSKGLGAYRAQECRGWGCRGLTVARPAQLLLKTRFFMLHTDSKYHDHLVLIWRKPIISVFRASLMKNRIPSTHPFSLHGFIGVAVNRRPC